MTDTTNILSLRQYGFFGCFLERQLAAESYVKTSLTKHNQKKLNFLQVIEGLVFNKQGGMVKIKIKKKTATEIQD